MRTRALTSGLLQHSGLWTQNPLSDGLQIRRRRSFGKHSAWRKKEWILGIPIFVEIGSLGKNA
jgi:hypothetical protein